VGAKRAEKTVKNGGAKETVLVPRREAESENKGTERKMPNSGGKVRRGDIKKKTKKAWRGVTRSAFQPFLGKEESKVWGGVKKLLDADETSIRPKGKSLGNGGQTLQSGFKGMQKTERTQSPHLSGGKREQHANKKIARLKGTALNLH